VTAVNAVGDYGSFDPAGLEREIDGMITVALDAAADLAPSL
jgi:hypothetical protein